MDWVTFSGASSCNGFDALRRWAAALAIVALWGLLAGAPAFADDQRSDCKPMPDNPMPGKVAVDAAPQINIGVLVNALIYYRCTEYDDQVKAVLNEASAWVAARASGVDKPAIVLDIDDTSLPTGNRFITTNSAMCRAALAISKRNRHADSATGS